MRVANGLLVLFVFLSTSAHSAPISWIATGYITQVDSGLITDIQVNDTFALRIDFDSLTPDLDSNEGRGRYLGDWVTLNINDFQAQNLGLVNYAPSITISDQWGGQSWDGLTVNSGLERHSAPLQGDRDLVAIVAQFQDDQGVVFNTGSLPLVPPDLVFMESARLELLFSNDYTSGIAAFDAKWIYGEITSLTAVPIPAAVYLFLSGLLALFSLKFTCKRYSISHEHVKNYQS